MINLPSLSEGSDSDHCGSRSHTAHPSTSAANGPGLHSSGTIQTMTHESNTTSDASLVSQSGSDMQHLHAASDEHDDLGSDAHANKQRASADLTARLSKNDAPEQALNGIQGHEQARHDLSSQKSSDGRHPTNDRHASQPTGQAAHADANEQGLKDGQQSLQQTGEPLLQGNPGSDKDHAVNTSSEPHERLLLQLQRQQILDSACTLPGKSDLLITDLLDHRWVPVKNFCML